MRLLVLTLLLAICGDSPAQTLITYTDTLHHLSISLPAKSSKWHTLTANKNTTYLFCSQRANGGKETFDCLTECSITLAIFKDYGKATNHTATYDWDYNHCCDSLYPSNINNAIAKGQIKDDKIPYLVYEITSSIPHQTGKKAHNRKKIEYVYKYTRGDDAFFLTCKVDPKKQKKYAELFLKVVTSVHLD